MSMQYYITVFVVVLMINCSNADDKTSPSLSKVGASQSENVSVPTISLPDVFIIVIDALRADHIGAYGYHRDTTPFIDTIAKRGLVFERAYSPSSFTRESVSALFMGRYPSSTPWSTGWYAQVSPEIKTLAECFAENGYQTIFCTDQPALEPEMFGKGFNLIEYYTDHYDESGNGDRIVENLLKRVSLLSDNTPLFVYIHFYDPHSPYEPFPSFYLRFADKIYSTPLRLYDEVRFNLPTLIEQGFGPGEERFEDLVLRYDAEIAMVDESVKRLYESVSKLRRNKEMLWIITADHGEEFLEHGFVEHAWRLYYESIHIPLIVYSSSTTAGSIRRYEEVSLVDIFPTLTKYLNFSFSDKWDGIALPLKEWLRGEDKPLQLDRVIISELNIPTRTIGISLIKDGWQYISWQKWLTWKECSEYASKQSKLREEYLQGKLSFPKFCSEPVYQEFISPDEKGYPKKSASIKENEALFTKLIDTTYEWCSKRPEMKPDIEKKNYVDELKQKNQRANIGNNSSKQPSSDTNEENFDSLKNAGYL